jgi:phage gp29-like protein
MTRKSRNLPAVVRPPATPALIASTKDGRDITRPYIWPLLQGQDSILDTRGGGDLELYTRVLDDDQAFSCWQQRVRAVVSRPWDVEPGDTTPAAAEAAEALKTALKAVGWDRVTEQMLAGVWYGYGVSELVWGARDGLWGFNDIVVLDRRRFRFDRDHKLRMLTAAAMLEGEQLPEQRFWTYSTGSTHSQNPYGVGLAHWCYWPTLFKREGVKFWMIFLEKFGAPTVLGKFPANAKQADIDKLLSACQAVATDAGVVIPEGMALELLEAARQGASTHDKVVAQMNSAIAKVILSQTMTTDDGASLSQAKVHEGVKLDVIRGDADLVNESFNTGPARWWTDYNYGPGVAAPRVVRVIEEPEDARAAAARDEILYRIGWERDDEAFVQAYGEGYRRREVQVPPALDAAQQQQPDDADQEQAAFADGSPPPDTVDTLVAATQDAAAKAMQVLVAPLRVKLAGVTDPEEARVRMLEAFEEMDSGPLAELLYKAGLLAAGSGAAGLDLTELTGLGR